ncbi:hypothetical protein B9Z55_024770 [Caenorhabditis nigoni]|uniref:Uncharacterized protein n=1 Tax=Caenorhabditis nigoni TaxID=1611254 RepID=A0A2G5SVF5_9PELO|nr:hypothetical protein B9Z55_024770 [Caenorhabditis nigoni]
MLKIIDFWRLLAEVFWCIGKLRLHSKVVEMKINNYHFSAASLPFWTRNDFRQRFRTLFHRHSNFCEGTVQLFYAGQHLKIFFKQFLDVLDKRNIVSCKSRGGITSCFAIRHLWLTMRQIDYETCSEW